MKGIIFVHIPKTGGHAVVYCTNAPKINRLTCPTGMHGTLQDFQNQLTAKNDSIENYHVLSITRNPWERLISSYNYFHVHAVINYYDPFVISWEKFVSFIKEEVSSVYTAKDDYFWEIDGKVYDKINFLNFDNLETELKTFLKDNNINEYDAPIKINTVPIKFEIPPDILANMNNFKDVVSTAFKYSIDRFGYKFPYTDNYPELLAKKEGIQDLISDVNKHSEKTNGILFTSLIPHYIYLFKYNLWWKKVLVLRQVENEFLLKMTICHENFNIQEYCRSIYEYTTSKHTRVGLEREKNHFCLYDYIT